MNTLTSSAPRQDSEIIDSMGATGSLGKVGAVLVERSANGRIPCSYQVIDLPAGYDRICNFKIHSAHYRELSLAEAVAAVYITSMFYLKSIKDDRKEK